MTSGPAEPEPLNGLVIPADLEQPVRVVNLRDGRPVYQALQERVGGTIDVVGLDEGDVWVNDIGRLIDLPLNVRASHWMLHDSTAGRDGRIGEAHMVYGDVVITGNPDRDGDATNVSPELVTHVQALELDPAAMKDWDTRNTEITITAWEADGPLPDIGL